MAEDKTKTSRSIPASASQYIFGFSILYLTRFNVGLMQYYANFFVYTLLFLSNYLIYQKFSEPFLNNPIPIAFNINNIKIRNHIIAIGAFSIIIALLYVFLFGYNVYPCIIQAILTVYPWILLKFKYTAKHHHIGIIFLNMVLALAFNQFPLKLEPYLFLIIIFLIFLEKIELYKIRQKKSIIRRTADIIILQALLIALNYKYILFLIPLMVAILWELFYFHQILKRGQLENEVQFNKKINIAIVLNLIAIFILQM